MRRAGAASYPSKLQGRRRLPAHGGPPGEAARCQASAHRASAITAAGPGVSPSAPTSPASSSSDAAKALPAAQERMPTQRRRQAKAAERRSASALRGRRDQKRSAHRNSWRLGRFGAPVH